MIIYNVKIKIAQEIEEEWFTWMSTVHIKDVINTGHFIGYTFMKLLLNGVPEVGTVTYEIQYECRDREELDAYLENDAETLRKEHHDKFGDGVKGASRSILADVTKKMINTERKFMMTHHA